MGAACTRLTRTPAGKSELPAAPDPCRPLRVLQRGTGPPQPGLARDGAKPAPFQAAKLRRVRRAGRAIPGPAPCRTGCGAPRLRDCRKRLHGGGGAGGVGQAAHTGAPSSCMRPRLRPAPVPLCCADIAPPSAHGTPRLNNSLLRHRHSPPVTRLRVGFLGPRGPRLVLTHEHLF